MSKWNLAADQGLSDDFQRWAWAQLEAQDRPAPKAPIAWDPVWRIETVDGVSTLRYMRADPAVEPGVRELPQRARIAPAALANRCGRGVRRAR